jgi:hypothetical protein
MKQFSTYALALAVILGSATAASESAQAFLLPGRTQTVPTVGDEEFVGPFASWANVKTNYGAAGDGVTDDIGAIQKGLNALSPNNPTLYFPAGTYRITGALNLAGQQYVNVIGQDPAVTTILWAGAGGGTMLYLNGVAYSRFDRLTFNGQGNAAVAVDQSKADATSNYFDTGNEYADDVFENAGIGLRCGNLGYGCAETSMLRGRFLNNTVAGISMGNFNALDMFVWYSLFQNNFEGLTNELGAGNFHVYNSIFQNSTHDIHIGHAGVFNFRNNYSIDSGRFIWGGATCAPYNITIQGNVILDTTQSDSILMGGAGPSILVDNTIRSLSTATAPIVNTNFCTFSDLFSIGNTFTVSSPEGPNSAGHYHSVQDQVVARSTVNPTMPTLPGTPPNNNRQIFEVTPGSTAAQIQQAINAAAASGTTRPVVHIQPGSYSINTTLAVPANSDLQIIGDGNYSVLGWSGTGSGPVLRLQGPSKAILRDFLVNGNGHSADGIEVDNADQSGSRVFMEQVNLGSSYTNLFVDGLDYTNLELHDFYHEYDATAGMTSVVVTGGPSAAAGLWQGGATNIFNGASSGSYITYGISNGAHVGIRDIWNDAASGQMTVANVTGIGTFTYAGAEVALPGTPGTLTAVSLDNFQGTAALINLWTNGNVDITGTGTGANVLGLGLVGPSTTFFSNSSSPAATVEFLNSETTVNPVSGMSSSELPEASSNPDTTFLIATLNQMRTQQPTLLAPLPSGVTDARFYRVFVSSANTGVHLEAGSVAP